MADGKNKPSFDVWLRWADVLGQRLQSICQIYADNDKIDPATQTYNLLSRLHYILAGAYEKHLAVMPYAALNQVGRGHGALEETQIQALARIFTATLEQMPAISTDMQKIMKSPWHGQCNGRAASDLFKGPRGTLNEGIGSGHPRDGQLPEVMDRLLQQESSGSARSPRQTTISDEDVVKRTETARRWALRNSAHLRRAGQVE